jgi:copper transport protein
MRQVLLFLLAVPGFSRTPTAPVHATLVSSEPAANSRLAASPARVRLVYSEPVEGKLARVTLIAGAGAPLVLRAGADPRDVHAVIAPVSDALAPGSYRVEWRVVSADGHPVDGTFVFDVGDTTLGSQPVPASPAAPEPEPEVEADVWGPSVAGAPVIPAVARGLALGALMAAAGLLLFIATAEPNAPQVADRRIRTLTMALVTAAPVLLVTHLLAWLVNTSPDHTLDAAWATSALGTTVGKIELWRAGLALLALWAWWLARRPRLALAFAASALAVSGASGHSAAIVPLWAIPSKAIHLLASAVWLGGLLWLVVRPAADDPHRFATDADRVSSRALAAVIAVAFTGVVQTRLFLTAWSDVVTSPYGWFVIAKTTGLLVLVAFGAYHRKLMPRMAAGSASDGVAMRGSVRREIVVMALVILLGGLLAYVPPPGEGDEASMSTQPSTS